MIRLKNRFGKANRKEMSWMSDLMETLRQEGISPDLLRAVEDYRAAHALPEALRPRIPASGFTYYGREVWEQALAALLCGENLNNRPAGAGKQASLAPLEEMHSPLWWLAPPPSPHFVVGLWMLSHVAMSLQESIETYSAP